MRRVVVSEWLDSDSGTPEEIRTGIKDLRNINRWFGGVRTTRKMILRVAAETGRNTLSVLDVASGGGDVPLLAQGQLRRSGLSLEVTLLDRVRSHLNGYMPSIVGDARSLPFADCSFDVVTCCLFAHHLEPGEMYGFVREAMRVCRTALIVNDLRRSALHLALVYAGLPLFRSRLTWHDAPASVRRAYTVEEMLQMLALSGARRLESSRHYLFRMGVIAWK